MKFLKRRKGKDGKPASQTPVPDIEGLLDFAISVDRASPLKFVGREDELKVFRRNLNSLWKKWTDAKNGDQPFWLGETFLFQGAPGAGKTAMLNLLKKEKIKIPIGDPSANLHYKAPVRVCMLERGDLKNMVDTKRKIARAFFPLEEKDKELAGMKITRKGGLKLGLMDITIEWIGGTSKEIPATVWEDITSEVRNNPDGHCPVLVMVDEAQNLDDEASEALDFLHQGNHGLPIIPVFGGLAWAVDRLDQLGVSRASLKRVYNLGRLSKEECMEAVLAFFDKFGVIGTEEEREEWAEMIADECMGWPQHLHAGFYGLAEAIAEAKGILANTDKTTAKEDGKAGRNEYYERRIRSFEIKFDDVRFLAAALAVYMEKKESGRPSTMRLARAIDTGVIRNVALNWPGMNLNEDDPDLALPEGKTGKELVDAMLHSGLLHKEKGGVLEVPIPCFVDYLKTELDRLAAGSGDSPQPTLPEPGM